MDSAPPIKKRKDLNPVQPYQGELTYPGDIQGHFIQYVADNVDHNIRTIDGHNTFHEMGIIAGVTPETKISRPVPQIAVTPEDIAAVGRINIHV